MRTLNEDGYMDPDPPPRVYRVPDNTIEYLNGPHSVIGQFWTPAPGWYSEVRGCGMTIRGPFATEEEAWESAEGGEWG